VEENNDLCRVVQKHLGQSIRIVAILCRVGENVLCGSDLFRVEYCDVIENNTNINTNIDNNNDVLAYDSIGPLYSTPAESGLFFFVLFCFFIFLKIGNTLYHAFDGLYSYAQQVGLYGASNTKEGASNTKEGASNTKEGASNTKEEKEKEQHIIVWKGKAGVMIELCVGMRSVVNENDDLCFVNCEITKQRLSFLMAADQLSLQASNSCALNDRFQSATEKLVESMYSDESPLVLLRSCKDLERIVRDFDETARLYGKLIISEVVDVVGILIVILR
jgi:hypothetical protein